MKTIGLTSLLFLLLCPWAASQSLVPTLMGTTGDFKTAGYSLSYSVGELSVTTLSGGDYFLTQGFQQPDSVFTIIGGPQTIEAFPNPVSTNLTINIFIEESPEFWVEIYNIKGSKVYQEKYTGVYYGSRKKIDFQEFPKGLYFVKIYSTNGKSMEKFKIVKM